MEILKNVGFVLLGVIATIAIFFVVVAIASSVNGISFGSQMTEWFGSIGEKSAEIVDTVTNTSNIM